jgi:hypothetical protein
LYVCKHDISDGVTDVDVSESAVGRMMGPFSMNKGQKGNMFGDCHVTVHAGLDIHTLAAHKQPATEMLQRVMHEAKQLQQLFLSSIAPFAGPFQLEAHL